MKPRLNKVRVKLVIFFLIFLKKKKTLPEARLYAVFIYVSLLIFHYTGESRFELEDEEEDEAEMAKTSLTENDDTQNDEEEDEEEDEAEMVKTSLTENDDTQNDEEEDEAEMVKTSLTENDESEGAIINIYEE